MTARNARLTFAPEARLLADLTTIAKLTGQPVSRVLSDALGMLDGFFHEVADSLRKVEAARKEADKLGKRYTGNFQRKLEPHLALATKALDAAQAEMVGIENSRPGGKKRPKQSQSAAISI